MSGYAVTACAECRRTQRAKICMECDTIWCDHGSSEHRHTTGGVEVDISMARPEELRCVSCGVRWPCQYAGGEHMSTGELRAREAAIRAREAAFERRGTKKVEAVFVEFGVMFRSAVITVELAEKVKARLSAKGITNTYFREPLP